MEIIIALVHLAEYLIHAHALEAGIVATNAVLIRVTWKAIPKADRPHRKLARRALRHRYHQDTLVPLLPNPRTARYVEWVD
jgi:hypothetical protein